MANGCEYCDDSFPTKEELGTHILLNHREKLDDTDGFSSAIPDGYLKEHEVKKGEQFGYRKQS